VDSVLELESDGPNHHNDGVCGLWGLKSVAAVGFVARPAEKFYAESVGFGSSFGLVLFVLAVWLESSVRSTTNNECMKTKRDVSLPLSTSTRHNRLEDKPCMI